MTIRTRLSLWYASIMFIALMVMGVLLYYQLVIEPREEAHHHHHHERDEEPVDPDVFEDVTSIVLSCGIPAALLAVAGGWWLMKKSLAPIASLTRATEKITAQNLGERLARTHNGDELDRLTEVFNSMLARLDDSFNRIREFTLHASHELKTPLTVLRGETETALRENSLSAAEHDRAVSQLDELNRLTRIVDGLTLLAKADAGQVSLNLETIRLDELVRDNFADLQILAEPHGVEVMLAACEEVSVRGDRHRLRQLLLNLADNAVKYNQPQGSVTMSLRRSGNAADFFITNTGAGIPPEILPRVFDRFYRGDAAHGNAVDGCGLGLSIAQWIVSAHGGKIQIASEPLKQTIVTVQLPTA
ncbi:MAG: ATP-binding protein [Verrucomicrobiae bacterium]|nr:ATP-binding protein [Verrucomicrobiae bacterium]